MLSYAAKSRFQYNIKSALKIQTLLIGSVLCHRGRDGLGKSLQPYYNPNTK
jgi:hypothetical protein